MKLGSWLAMIGGLLAIVGSFFNMFFLPLIGGITAVVGSLWRNECDDCADECGYC